jgi:hypothetical protein
MGRRTKNRVKAVLPVRASGTDAEGKRFTSMLYTLDISATGARLGGFRGNLNVGDTITIQYHNYQVKHRVCWIKPAVKGADMLLGVESLQPDKEIWGVKLAAAYKDDYVPPPPPPQRHYEKRDDERRKHTRFPVSGTAIVSNPEGEEKQTLRFLDLSLEGCFIETPEPFAAGARVKLLIKVHETDLDTFGVVRASLPKAGMGVQFTHFTAADADRLRGIIDRLEQEQQGKAPTAAPQSSPTASGDTISGSTSAHFIRESDS